jgi:hypothetical protein
MADVPAKLRAKRGSMEADFGPSFAPFFRWLFEMGKAIAALNNNVQSGAVRTVPLSVRASAPHTVAASCRRAPPLARVTWSGARPVIRRWRRRAWR